MVQSVWRFSQILFVCLHNILRVDYSSSCHPVVFGLSAEILEDTNENVDLLVKYTLSGTWGVLQAQLNVIGVQPLK